MEIKCGQKNAFVLMLSVAKLYFEKNDKENHHAFHDVGAATSLLTIQATSLGLFIHQMAGFDVPRARKLYNIPEGYEPVAAIAVGYPGLCAKRTPSGLKRSVSVRRRRRQAYDIPEALPEQYQQREFSLCQRKPIETFVFTGS